MAPDAELVTVYRSGDADAESDAIRVRDRLAEAGMEAIVVGDDQPGVVVGTFEVRVPAADGPRAEQVLADSPDPEGEDELVPSDASHDLDMVAVFSSQAVDAEMEAETVRGILEANGIPTVIVGSAQIPVVPVEVRVPQSRLEEAGGILAEARAEGPAMAEEAELEAEAEGTPGTPGEPA